MRIAAEHGIDLEQVEGTGRGGRVRKPDVLALPRGRRRGAAEEPPMHIESPYKPDEPVAEARKPRCSAEARRGGRRAGGEPLSRMRQSIGRAMIESLQTAATCTTIVEADMTADRARARADRPDLPALRRRARRSRRWASSPRSTPRSRARRSPVRAVNLGIAVSLGEGGLIVPVIHDAQDLSVEGLGKAIKALARKARDNQLTPDDVRGGTFTITNPGGYGSIMATPVINLPQVAILDTEAVVKRPVVITDERATTRSPSGHMTYLCMSWDHRALDGALAAQFLAALRKRLEWWN